MEILLDTTVQIERIFKRGRKEQIEKIISEHVCGSSTYVLGEYKKNIVRDFARVYYIYNDICKMYNDDYELVKEHVRMYGRLLERRFKYGIDKELINETDCHRAKAEVQYQKGKAEIPGVKCAKKDNFCKSCEFFEKHKEKICELKDRAGLPKEMKDAIEKMVEKQEPMKGNLCKTMGDCIISLEALATEGKTVCTTNEQDFKPICDSIGVKLCVPGKSDS
ncbi:MAG: hypothetical protein HFH48_07885 [Lachnospiraceae bacterium]|nr:hypothetical protein [Lachnospiraceae bacterium]